MHKVIIFGLNNFASLSHFYLTQDSPYEVIAFTTFRAFLPESMLFEGLPIIAFEDIKLRYPPEQFAFFAPISDQNMNKERERIYLLAKSMGYKCISYISSKVSLFPGTQIGENCFILEDNTLQPFCQIGNNVTLWSGNHIGHHSIIHDHVFLHSHVVISGQCKIEPYTVIESNATLRDGVTLASGSLIKHCSCIVKDTESWSLYQGTPAKKVDKITISSPDC